MRKCLHHNGHMRRLSLLVALLLLAGASIADNTKTVSGKLRSIKDNVLVIQKSGMVGTSTEEIEMNEATKKTGQVLPGMHVKVKYREEEVSRGQKRKIAVEIEARPEFASKEAKEASKQTTKPQ